MKLKLFHTLMEDALLFTQQSRYFVVFSQGLVIGMYDTFTDNPDDVIQEKSQIYTDLTWKYVEKPIKIKQD